MVATRTIGRQHPQIKGSKYPSSADIDDDKDIVFSFSVAEPMGVASLFSRKRLVGVTRAMGTIVIGFTPDYDFDKDSGARTKKAKAAGKFNFWRIGASVTGLWANAVALFFGNNKGDVKGHLNMIAGEWVEKDDVMQQKLPGALPWQAEQILEETIADYNFSPKSIETRFSKKQNYTTISVKKEVFENFQKALHEIMNQRTRALEVIFDKNNYLQNTLDKDSNISIDLSKYDEKLIKNIRSIINEEWRINADIQTTVDKKILHVSKFDREKFLEQVNLQNHANIATPKDPGHITVNVHPHEEVKNPGFIETFLNPHKYPNQHSLFMGVLVSNSLRTFAGMANKSPKYDEEGKLIIETKGKYESAASLLSIVSGMVEMQPEVVTKKGQVIYKPSMAFGIENDKLSNFQNYLNERPLLAAAPLRGPSIMFKYIDAYKNRDANNGQFMDGYRLFSTGCSTVANLLTMTMKKSDYGV